MKVLSSMPAKRYKSEKTYSFLEKIGIHGSAYPAQKHEPKATIGSEYMNCTNAIVTKEVLAE